MLEFKKSHHLIDQFNNILYCYVAKNACSTIKFHFLKKKLLAAGDEIPDKNINRNVHSLAKKHSVKDIPSDLFKGYYSFFIVRHPYSRIASAFLDKFVQSSTLPQYARKLMVQGGAGDDADDWTFSDFVRSLTRSDVRLLNEHWMPQYLHIIKEVDYDFIPMESFSEHPRLRELYGDLTTNVREHSLQYADVDEPAHLTPIRDLKKSLQEMRVVPPWRALVQPELESDLLRVFGPDFDLYEKAKEAVDGMHDATTNSRTSSAIQIKNVSPVNSEQQPLDRRESHGLVSVVLPVYNVECYIGECMESLATQDDDHFELIVVDDGSTDSSIDIVKTYADRFDRLRIHRQENRGLGGARNTGIRLAEGDFVLFVDSDDIVASNLVSALRRRQQDGDFDIVSGRFQLMSENGELLGPPTEQPVPNINPALSHYERVLGGLSPSVACARLFRKRTLLDSKILFRNSIPHEDLFFTYKLLRKCVSHSRINDYVYFWRQRAQSISKSITRDHINILPELRRDTYTFLDQISASEREYALAARRNLVMLENFRRKILNNGGEALDYFKNMIHSYRDEILQDFSRVKQSDIKEVFVPINILQMAKLAFQKEETSPAQSATGAVMLDFAFFPLRAYHLRECDTVLKQIRKLGFRAEVINTDNFRNGKDEVLQAAEEFGIKVIAFQKFIEQRMPVRCVVMWNDWDPLMRIVARACHEAGITTVGWVEGVQDYYDVDTGRLRSPYLRSRHVILPGAFDKKYFKNTGQTLHIGEVVRIKPLWEGRRVGEKKSNRPKALINSNFSYGVLEEYRDRWVKDAVEACLAVGFEPVLSRHPFDTGTLYAEYQTKKSFFDAIRECDVSIQRFGSGILEGLASGVPVIYFNPHGEKIDKFTSPEGAYLLTTTRDELESILVGRTFFWNEEKAKAFLELHTGLSEQEGKAGGKIARILENVLRDAEAPCAALAENFANNPPPDKPKALKQEALKIGPFYGPSAKTGSLSPIRGQNDPPRSAAKEDVEALAFESASQKRPFYSPFGDWLKWRSPRLFRMLRFMRRAAVDMRHGRLTTIAETVRARSLVLFRMGQIAVWSVRAARRHPIASAAFLFVVVLLTSLPAYVPLWPYRAWFWAGAVLAGLTGTGIAVFAAAHKVVQDMLNKQAGHIMATARKTKKQHVAKLEKRTEALKAEVKTTTKVAKTGKEALKAEIETVDETAKAREEALKSQFVEMMQAEIATLTEAVRARDDTLKAEIKAATEAAKASEKALKVEFGEKMQTEMTTLAETMKAGDDALKAEIETAVETARAGDEALKAEIVKLDAQALKAEFSEVMQTEIAALHTVLDRDRTFSNYGNASALRVHSRKLSEADIEYIRKHWLKLFGLSLSGRKLSYLAHQICLAEERCEGRMATTIQAAMLRTLALLSLQTKKIELLEIGTLFGISAGALCRAGIRAQREMYMTLIDPLEGYYDQGLTDNQTGVPINRNILVSNLSSLGLTKTHYRIIQGLSTDPEALNAASDRRYDYVLIDGDHSLEGVASDYELYGPLVKPGGLLIFDDYDTTDWPAIKPFVDEHVRPNEDWLWIGSGWRTAILRRKRRGDSV